MPSSKTSEKQSQNKWRFQAIVFLRNTQNNRRYSFPVAHPSTKGLPIAADDFSHKIFYSSFIYWTIAIDYSFSSKRKQLKRKEDTPPSLWESLINSAWSQKVEWFYRTDDGFSTRYDNHKSGSKKKLTKLLSSILFMSLSVPLPPL